jgi:hypothetical protein
VTDSYQWSPVPAFPSRDTTEEETIWRMKGFLDCLRHLEKYGPVDPKYIDYLVEKTGEKHP